MKILLLVPLLLLSASCLDFKANQTLYVLAITRDQETIPTFDFCVVETSWKAGSPNSLQITPSNGWCTEDEPYDCSVQTLTEFFVDNADAIATLNEWAKYIPNLHTVFLPLKCASKDKEIGHILLFNGVSGVSAATWEGNVRTGSLVLNGTETFSPKAVEFSGSVIQSIDAPGDNCTEGKLYGTVEFSNYLPFQNLAYQGTVDVALANVTLGSQSLANVKLECFYAWEGAYLLMTQCTSSQLPSNYKVSFEPYILNGGFVVLGFQFLNESTSQSNLCTYIFKARTVGEALEASS